MEHTEWEAQTQPSPNSSLSLGQSQPVRIRTKYSFTGYEYLTDASMHAAARSPLHQLFKRGQGHSPQAPRHDGMQRHSPGRGTAPTQEQSSLNLSGRSQVNDVQASTHAQGNGHADGGQQSREEEDVCWQEQGSRHTQVNGHSQHCDAAASHEDEDEHQRKMQRLSQQQKQHCRFKIIDFGHADLEPVEGYIAPGLVRTKYGSLSNKVKATVINAIQSHSAHLPYIVFNVFHEQGVLMPITGVQLDRFLYTRLQL